MNVRLDFLQRLFTHEERRLHRAIVAPEPNGAARSIVVTTSIRKGKGHRVCLYSYLVNIKDRTTVVSHIH
jgi:hypothetical protein